MSGEYLLIEQGVTFARVVAASAEDALDAAPFDDTAYGNDHESTIFVRIVARSAENDSDASARTFTIDPPEPKCGVGGRHDWQAPHRIVGGCKENPGVYAHDGGVTIQEVCVECGCGRLIDTWAMNPDDGTSGHRSLSYDVGKYADVFGVEVES